MIKFTDIRIKLAMQRQQNGEYDLALSSYIKYFDKDPKDPIINYLLGSIYFEMKNIEKSKKFLDNAIESKPFFPEALNLRGIIYKEWGQLEEAQKDLNSALVIQENFPEALNNLADIYRLEKKYLKAKDLLNKAIRLNPKLAEAYNNLGAIERDTKNFGLACIAFKKALSLNSKLYETELNLALAIDKVGETASAMKLALKVATSHPQNAAAQNCLGMLYLNQNKLILAEGYFKKACSLQPNYSEAHNNLASTFLKKNEVQKALKYFDIALGLDSANPDFWANKSVAYQAQNQTQKAIDACNRALKIDPNHIDGKWNRGIAYLLSGDLLQGFSDYESRWRLPEFKSIKRDSVLWVGQKLFNKSILVYSEQGFGDTIQFARYVNKLAKLKPNLIYFETQSALKTLINQINSIDAVNIKGEPSPKTDYHVSLMSLPYIFKTNINTIPNQVPYLHLPRIPNLKITKNPSKKLRVGICWKGRSTHKNDSNRSMNIKHLFPLFEMADIQFFNLQLDHGETSALEQYQIVDLSIQITDFSSTALLIKELDLIITVDTALAHLSGALGFRCWVLLPFSPDWRWFLKTSISPWYPTLKLFRQEEIGNWGSLISVVKQTLAKEISH